MFGKGETPSFFNALWILFPGCGFVDNRHSAEDNLWISYGQPV